MTKIYSMTVPVDADIVDAFCVMQKGFTDQFVYYDKERPVRYMGLGRCIALPTLEDVDFEQMRAEDVIGEDVDASPQVAARAAQAAAGGSASCAGGAAEAVDQPAVFFSFNRFDAENPAPVDELQGSFPRLRFMLPEVVLIENERGRMLQVNSLGPVYPGRVERFLRMCKDAPRRTRVSVPYAIERDSREAWMDAMDKALDAIAEGRVEKVVLSRRQKLVAQHPFSSKDLLVNLIDGSARGKVILYRYADVFFCGCTPELLVRKRGNAVESMCLAGTCPAGADEEERARLARELMADEKNRGEHDYVVRFIREVFNRTCYDVDVPATPGIMSLAHVQHLHTPARAKMLEGVDIRSMAEDLHPTPATSGTPVGEAKMLLRRIESYNRGFYAGAAGFVDAAGDGEFAVALRTGVFDGEIGWVYAGCGIVAGSDAAAEYDEIDLKLKTVLSAFDGESTYEEKEGDVR